MKARIVVTVVVVVWAVVLVTTAFARYPGFYGADFRETQPLIDPIETYGSLLIRMPAWRNEIFSPGSTFNYRESLDRQGVDKEDLVRLPVRIAWRSEEINIGVHSASKSSPAVDASGVYVGSDSGWIYAFTHAGEVKWRFHAAGAGQGIHGSASLDDKNVYIGAYNGRLYCLDKKTGEVKWVREVADAIGSSPLIEDGYLYVSAETSARYDGYLSKFAKDGRLIWATRWLGEQVHSSPALDPARRLVFLGANNGKLFAFNADDGRMLWEKNLGGPIKGTPLVAAGRVFVTSWAKKLHAVDEVTGEVVWETSLMERSQSSPTLVPGTGVLVVASHRKGALYGIGSDDGRLLWARETGSSMNMSSGVAVRDAHRRWYVWIPCFENMLCAVEPMSGKVLQKIDVGRPITGVPAVYDGQLYIALDRGAVVKLESDL